MKNAVFWDVLQSGFPSHVVFISSVLQLLVTANEVPCSLILVTPMMEAIRSCETSVLI
jgi:hypothetical protein